MRIRVCRSIAFVVLTYSTVMMLWYGHCQTCADHPFTLRRNNTTYGTKLRLETSIRGRGMFRTCRDHNQPNLLWRGKEEWRVVKVS